MRQTGNVSFSQNYEVSKLGPLDARTVVEYKSDLTSITADYVGLVVAVQDTGNLYILTLKPASTASNWKLVGGANLVVTSSTRKIADTYSEKYTGMMVTESNTGNVYIYTGSTFTAEAMELDSNWKQVGDDSSSISAINGNITTINGNITTINSDIDALETDVANIAALNTVKGNITSWEKKNNEDKLCGGKLRTYNTSTNQITENSNYAIEIPYATTSLAGVMSPTDKTNLSTAYTFATNYVADLAITSTTIDLIINGTYVQSQS